MSTYFYLFKNSGCKILIIVASLFWSPEIQAQQIPNKEETGKTNSSDLQKQYESDIKSTISLLDSIPENHANTDSLIFKLYNKYKQQYLSLGRENQWAKALPLALACEKVFSGRLSPKEEAELIYNIAYIYDKDEQYFTSVNYFEKSIKLYQSIWDKGDRGVRNELALAYNNLGVVHAHTGFFTERKFNYLKAKALWESENDVNKANLISLYGNLLRLYRQYGDKKAAKQLITEINSNFDEWLAEDLFSDGLDAMETEKPQWFYHVEKHRLNILYTDLTSDKAGGTAHLDSLRFYFNKMDFEDQKRFSPYLLTAISGAAAPLVDYDNPAERNAKKKYLDLGMKKSILYNDRYNEMIFHSLLVSFALDADQDAAAALSHLNQAIQIGHEMDIREFNLLNLYFKKGDVLQNQGRFSDAEELVLKGLSVLLDEVVTDPTAVTIYDFAHRNDIFYIKALRQVAGIYKSEYELNKNPDHGWVALHFSNLAARLFNVYYQKGAYNPSLNMTISSINEGLLSLHLSLGATNNANLISIIENNRTQHLSKEFEAKHLRFLRTPGNLFTARNLLQSKAATFSHQKDQETKAYKTLRARLQKLESKIQRTDSKYFSFFSDTLNISEIQSQLQEGEYIVRYTSGPENLYAYTIQKDNITVIKLGDRNAILQQVELYHEALKTIKNDYIEQAKALYATLIVPLQLPLDQVKKLVFIPENKLNYIPFETLIHPDLNLPLVSLCAISYSHGLKLWLLQEKATPAQREQQLFAAFAPQYSTDYMAAFVGDKPLRRNRLQDIAGATQEAMELSQYFDGNLFQGEKATKGDFLQRTTDFKIYHFAMHALLDESDPLNSSLVFQNGEHLRYHELYRLHFPAEMVVLSACNTGMGKLESGEGLMSLSRALTYSGVRSAVYSLWEVPDEETAEIMLSFYEHLKFGLSKAEALTRAKRDFLDNNPLKSHPFFWAGFVINGNTDALIENAPSYVYAWVIAVGVLVIALSIMLWKIKQRLKV